MDLRKIGKRKVAVVFRETSIRDAARIMRESHLGDVVVVERVENKMQPVGILTDRDIVMTTASLGVSPLDFTVGDLMTSCLVTARNDSPLGHVIEQMKLHGVKRIPIVNEEGELDGILALEDVMRLLTNELHALSEVFESQQALERDRRRLVS